MTREFGGLAINSSLLGKLTCLRYVQNDDVMGGRSNSNLKLSGSGAESCS